MNPYRGRAARRSAALASVGLLLAGAGLAYPLDGYEATGIRRLEGMRLAQQGAVRDVKQPPGALLNTAQLEPRVLGQTFDLPAPDPGFTQRIVAVLGGNLESSGLAVLDLSDPAKPIYAEHRGSTCAVFSSAPGGCLTSRTAPCCASRMPSSRRMPVAS